MNKTIEKHYNRITKIRKFEKREINALTKLMAGSRFRDNDLKSEIYELLHSTCDYSHDQYISSHYQCEFYLFKKACKITKEQTTQGKAWLKTYYIKNESYQP